jgi:photosystem II stability/assembly factor-like uncharacterized protein
MCREIKSASATLSSRIVPFLLTFLLIQLVPAYRVWARQGKSTITIDTALYDKMQWREIGPFRGGRSIAVTGIKDQPYTYYFGATGGGIWKTEDGGNTWINVSDGYLKVGIVGALAVAPSDPNVIYAGTGEACIRGNAMPGEGIYKSVDAGKTWKYTGLAEAQTISKICVDPKDEDLVYAAVLGHPFGPNPERGVYRSRDGGKTWQRVLFKNDKTGAVDLIIDPNNSRVLYAALWEASRSPWDMISGGPGSGLWKSTDGGDTWTDISANHGLPKGILGKIGIAVSPAKTDRVWASVEAKEGGLFLSDDGGKTWRKVNAEQRIRQRAWYFSHIYADPKNPETVYILNVQFFKSIDGGKTLTTIFGTHSDNHDLWIDPNNPERMIEGNDGGATVSENGGRTWTDEDIPTAQFYHVVLDNQFPYHIYGAQQDNSTVGIASRTTGFGITRQDWYDVGGGESGYIAVNLDNPNIVYAGNYGGLITRYDHTTHQEQDVSPWPDNPMGYGADSLRYRFQWTFPIVISPYDSKTIYATANVVFKSTDEGMSWNVISPDLTTNDKSKQGPSGGPITKDNTSVEYYCTIFAFAESPVKRGVLWAGSDDGLIHVSRDGGATWQNVTPKDLPKWSTISIIDPSPHDSATAYVAAQRYRLDDFRPLLYKTSDFGKTWKKIVKGLPEDEFTHVIREDPHQKGLLYAGTERGIYVSFNDGNDWQSLQLNLPVVPVHDLAIQARDNELVAATHGRSFWILDDLNLLYQMNDKIVKEDAHLFKPGLAYRMGGGSFSRPGLAIGKNPPNGVVVYYNFAHKPKGDVKLDFLDEKGSLIKSFSTKEEKKENGEGGGEGFFRRGGPEKIPADSGLNRFVWNMRYPDATKVPGAILWSGGTEGPVVVPGMYQVKLEEDGKSQTEPFEIRKDPRLSTTPEEFKEQLNFLLKIRDKLTQLDVAVNTIREIRQQTDEFVKKLGKLPAKDTIANTAKRMNQKLTDVEDELIQVKSKSSEDPLNFPIKLNDKLAGIGSVVESADTKPTKQSYDLYTELAGRIDEQLAKFKQVVDTDLPAFNNLVKTENVPAVILKPEEPNK